MANSKSKNQPQQKVNNAAMATEPVEVTPVQQASQIILDAKEQVNFILNDPAYVHNLLSINAALNNLLTKLSFIGGITMGAGEKKHSFPPITSFMGQPVTRAKMVSADDLNPKEAERKQYIAQVDKLQRDIHGIATDNVIKAYTIGDDEAILRGVARRAGLANYADGVINSEFVNQIKSSLIAKDDQQELQDKIDEALDAKEVEGLGFSGEGDPAGDGHSELTEGSTTKQLNDLTTQQSTEGLTLEQEEEAKRLNASTPQQPKPSTLNSKPSSEKPTPTTGKNGAKS